MTTNRTRKRSFLALLLVLGPLTIHSFTTRPANLPLISSRHEFSHEISSRHHLNSRLCAASRLAVPFASSRHVISYSRAHSHLCASTLTPPPKKVPSNEDKRDPAGEDEDGYPHIVLVAGFESFNRDLYTQAVSGLPLHLTVFADSDIRVGPAVSEEETGINPVFAQAVENADAFIGSLIFDYDDVLAVKKLLEDVQGPRLIFESATELMEYNMVGTFNMKSSGDGPAGPPPAVKAVISKFSSGKEEDKVRPLAGLVL